MEAIWQLLQIEPTADVATIKRAYARKLRVTRPDDDAQAYQELRYAYEWALQYARWQRERAEQLEQHQDDAEHVEAVETIETSATTAQSADALATPQPQTEHGAGEQVIAADTPVYTAIYADWSADAEPSAAPAPSAHAEAAQPEWTHPDALAHGSLAQWQAHGDEALLNAWPALQQQLARIPLTLRGESSAAFADLVLAHDDLPFEFVEQLAAYFGWGTDFRVDQLLGAQRAEALREWLASTREWRETAQHDYAEVTVLEQLFRHGKAGGRFPYKAYLFVLLAHPLLYERVKTAPQRVLGLDQGHTGLLRQATEIAQWLRTAALALVVSLIEPVSLSAFDLAWPVRAVLIPIMFAAGLVLVRMIEFAWRKRFGDKDPMNLGELRDSWLAQMIGVTCFVAAWATAPATLDDLSRLQRQFAWGWVGLMCVGTIFVWPHGKPWTKIMPGLALVTTLSLCRLFYDTNVNLPGIALAAIWLTLCHALLVHRHEQVLAVYRAPWAVWRPSSVWGWIWLVIAFKFVLGFIGLTLALTLPLTMMVFCVFAGHRLPLAGMVTALLLVLLGHSSDGWMLVASVLITLFLVLMQDRIFTPLSRTAWLRAP